MVLARGLIFLTILLTSAGVIEAITPDNLPLPADQVMYMPENAGADIGLPLGATTAYTLGRSLAQQGEIEAALVYLNRAYRLAPQSWKISEAYALTLSEAGFYQDAARIYGELVTSEPDSLEQRRRYALLLAQAGRPRAALDQVTELRKQGENDGGLIKLQADLLGSMDRVDQAVEVYLEARDQDPANAEDYTLAAGALLQRHERFDDMAELLEEGLEDTPTSQPMCLALVRYLVHEGRLEEASNTARDGDKARLAAGLSDRPECSLEMAELLARRGDFEAAAEVLQDIRDAGIRDREAESNLARYLMGLGRVEDALNILPEASARWPEDAQLLYLWGRALEMQDDLDGAYSRLRQAILLQPELALYRVTLLRLLVINEREDLTADPPDDRQLALQQEARRHAQQASVTVHPQDADGHMILGYTFRSLGDHDRACRQFQMASEVNETRVAALLELGFCLQEAGRLTEARKTLRNLQAEYPDDPEVANSYGYFLAEQGEDLEEAERLVKQALRSAPDNGAYLDSMGWVYFQQGDYSEAFDWLIKATNSRGDDPVILEHLGRTLAKLGQKDEALDILRRALAAGGDADILNPLIEDLQDGP